MLKVGFFLRASWSMTIKILLLVSDESLISPSKGSGLVGGTVTWLHNQRDCLEPITRAFSGTQKVLALSSFSFVFSLLFSDE